MSILSSPGALAPRGLSRCHVAPPCPQSSESNPSLQPLIPGPLALCSRPTPLTLGQPLRLLKPWAGPLPALLPGEPERWEPAAGLCVFQ